MSKDPIVMSRTELRVELRVAQISADTAWKIAGDLVEKVGELEKRLAEALGRARKDEGS
jgi:hypothetical protein